MKKLALIAAVVFTTISLESCRQPDELLSNEEAATLQKVRDASQQLLDKNDVKSTTIEQNITEQLVDGEIIPPPRK